MKLKTMLNEVRCQIESNQVWFTWDIVGNTQCRDKIEFKLLVFFHPDVKGGASLRVL